MNHQFRIPTTSHPSLIFVYRSTSLTDRLDDPNIVQTVLAPTTKIGDEGERIVLGLVD